MLRMNNSQHIACPYGPEFQIYWDMRYRLFSKFDQAMVDATGLYTMLPEAFALDMAKRASGSKTVDICSGIGSMSVALAVADRIDFRHADITSTATLQALPDDIDTLFLDPPWGYGPGDYQRRQVSYLEGLQLAGFDLRVLVTNITCREVMMRLPPNFDIGIFRQARGEKLAYVTRTGYLHWYYIRVPKQEFLRIPDRSAPHFNLEESRRGFEAYFIQ